MTTDENVQIDITVTDRVTDVLLPFDRRARAVIERQLTTLIEAGLHARDVQVVAQSLATLTMDTHESYRIMMWINGQEKDIREHLITEALLEMSKALAIRDWPGCRQFLDRADALEAKR